MKALLPLLRFRAVLFAVSLASASATGFAQQDSERPRARRDDDPFGPPRVEREVDIRRERMRPGPDGLGPEQRRALRDAMQQVREKSRNLAEKLRESRAKLQDAIWAQNLRENVVREHMREVTKLETELALIRARALASIRPKLTQEQLERLRAARAELGDRIRERVRERVVDRVRPQDQERPAPRANLRNRDDSDRDEPAPPRNGRRSPRREEGAPEDENRR